MRGNMENSIAEIPSPVPPWHDRRVKWDLRYLIIALNISVWSKDPDKQVGAVITDDRYIRGVGYNGLPRGIEDSDEKLKNKGTKLDLTIHAEENALFSSGNKGTCIYVYPCLPCTRCFSKLCQTDIRRVVSLKANGQSSWAPGTVYKMLIDAGFEVELYTMSQLIQYQWELMTATSYFDSFLSQERGGYF
jgi:dCMP deaminase